MRVDEIWNFVTLFNEIVHVFTFDIEWDTLDFSRNWNWFLLQNRPLQYRFLQCRFLQCRLHQIVQYRWNPLFWGLLGLIRKRLVGFRLDFLAGFLQVSLAGFLQVWLTFLPSSCLCSRCVSLGPTAISYASCMGFLLYRLRFVSRAAPWCDRRNVWWRDWIILIIN